MKQLLTTIIFATVLNCYGQKNFEQSALDFFDSVIRPEFVQYRNEQMIFYFKNKSTNKLSDLDFSSTKRPFNHSYKVDFDKLGVKGRQTHSDKDGDTCSVRLNMPHVHNKMYKPRKTK